MHIFRDHEGRIVDCYESQRLSFTGSLKNLFREEKKDEDLRFAPEKIQRIKETRQDGKR